MQTQRFHTYFICDESATSCLFKLFAQKSGDANRSVRYLNDSRGTSCNRRFCIPCDDEVFVFFFPATTISFPVFFEPPSPITTPLFHNRQ